MAKVQRGWLEDRLRKSFALAAAAAAGVDEDDVDVGGGEDDDENVMPAGAEIMDDVSEVKEVLEREGREAKNLILYQFNGEPETSLTLTTTAKNDNDDLTDNDDIKTVAMQQLTELHISNEVKIMNGAEEEGGDADGVAVVVEATTTASTTKLITTTATTDTALTSRKPPIAPSTIVVVPQNASSSSSSLHSPNPNSPKKPRSPRHAARLLHLSTNIQTSQQPSSRSQSIERQSISELQSRYWSLLFTNLKRAINEIYQTAEIFESIPSCEEAILVLENYVRDFKALAEWFKVSNEYESMPNEQRPLSITWEVRKSNPARRIRAKSASSPNTSGASSPCAGLPILPLFVACRSSDDLSYKQKLDTNTNILQTDTAAEKEQTTLRQQQQQKALILCKRISERFQQQMQTVGETTTDALVAAGAGAVAQVTAGGLLATVVTEKLDLEVNADVDESTVEGANSKQKPQTQTRNEGNNSSNSTGNQSGTVNAANGGSNAAAGGQSPPPPPPPPQPPKQPASPIVDLTEEQKAQQKSDGSTQTTDMADDHLSLSEWRRKVCKREALEQLERQRKAEEEEREQQQQQAALYQQSQAEIYQPYLAPAIYNDHLYYPPPGAATQPTAAAPTAQYYEPQAAGAAPPPALIQFTADGQPQYLPTAPGAPQPPPPQYIQTQNQQGAPMFVPIQYVQQYAPQFAQVHHQPLPQVAQVATQSIYSPQQQQQQQPPTVAQRAVATQYVQPVQYQAMPQNLIYQPQPQTYQTDYVQYEALPPAPLAAVEQTQTPEETDAAEAADSDSNNDYDALFDRERQQNMDVRRREQYRAPAAQHTDEVVSTAQCYQQQAAAPATQVEAAASTDANNDYDALFDRARQRNRREQYRAQHTDELVSTAQCYQQQAAAATQVEATTYQQPLSYCEQQPQPPAYERHRYTREFKPSRQHKHTNNYQQQSTRSQSRSQERNYRGRNYAQDYTSPSPSQPSQTPRTRAPQRIPYYRQRSQHVSPTERGSNYQQQQQQRHQHQYSTTEYVQRPKPQYAQYAHHQQHQQSTHFVEYKSKSQPTTPTPTGTGTFYSNFERGTMSSSKAVPIAKPRALSLREVNEAIKREATIDFYRMRRFQTQNSAQSSNWQQHERHTKWQQHERHNDTTELQRDFQYKRQNTGQNQLQNAELTQTQWANIAQIKWQNDDDQQTEPEQQDGGTELELLQTVEQIELQHEQQHVYQTDYSLEDHDNDDDDDDNEDNTDILNHWATRQQQELDAAEEMREREQQQLQLAAAAAAEEEKTQALIRTTDTTMQQQVTTSAAAATPFTTVPPISPIAAGSSVYANMPSNQILSGITSDMSAKSCPLSQFVPIYPAAPCYSMSALPYITTQAGHAAGHDIRNSTPSAFVSNYPTPFEDSAVAIEMRNTTANWHVNTHSFDEEEVDREVEAIVQQAAAQQTAAAEVSTKHNTPQTHSTPLPTTVVPSPQIIQIKPINTAPFADPDFPAIMEPPTVKQILSVYQQAPPDYETSPSNMTDNQTATSTADNHQALSTAVEKPTILTPYEQPAAGAYYQQQPSYALPWRYVSLPPQSSDRRGSSVHHPPDIQQLTVQQHPTGSTDETTTIQSPQSPITSAAAVVQPTAVALQHQTISSPAHLAATTTASKTLPPVTSAEIATTPSRAIEIQAIQPQLLSKTVISQSAESLKAVEARPTLAHIESQTQMTQTKTAASVAATPAVPSSQIRPALIGKSSSIQRYPPPQQHKKFGQTIATPISTWGQPKPKATLASAAAPQPTGTVTLPVSKTTAPAVPSAVSTAATATKPTETTAALPATTSVQSAALPVTTTTQSAVMLTVQKLDEMENKLLANDAKTKPITDQTVLKKPQILSFPILQAQEIAAKRAATKQTRSKAVTQFPRPSQQQRRAAAANQQQAKTTLERANTVIHLPPPTQTVKAKPPPTAQAQPKAQPKQRQPQQQQRPVMGPPTNVATRLSARSRTAIDLKAEEIKAGKAMPSRLAAKEGSASASNKSSREDIGSSTSTLKASSEAISSSQCSLVQQPRTSAAGQQNSKGEKQAIPSNSEGWSMVQGHRRHGSMAWSKRFDQPTGSASLPTLALSDGHASGDGSKKMDSKKKAAQNEGKAPIAPVRDTQMAKTTDRGEAAKKFESKKIEPKKSLEKVEAIKSEPKKEVVKKNDKFEAKKAAASKSGVEKVESKKVVEQVERAEAKKLEPKKVNTGKAADTTTKHVEKLEKTVGKNIEKAEKFKKSDAKTVETATKKIEKGNKTDTEKIMIQQVEKLEKSENSKKVEQQIEKTQPKKAQQGGDKIDTKKGEPNKVEKFERTTTTEVKKAEPKSVEKDDSKKINKPEKTEVKAKNEKDTKKSNQNKNDGKKLKSQGSFGEIEVTTTSMKSDNLAEKYDKGAEKSDKVAEKSDKPAEKFTVEKNDAKKPIKSDNKPDTKLPPPQTKRIETHENNKKPNKKSSRSEEQLPTTSAAATKHLEQGKSHKMDAKTTRNQSTKIQDNKSKDIKKKGGSSKTEKSNVQASKTPDFFGALNLQKHKNADSGELKTSSEVVYSTGNQTITKSNYELVKPLPPLKITSKFNLIENFFVGKDEKDDNERNSSLNKSSNDATIKIKPATGFVVTDQKDDADEDNADGDEDYYIDDELPSTSTGIRRQISDLTGLKLTALHKEFLRNEQRMRRKQATRMPQDLKSKFHEIPDDYNYYTNLQGKQIKFTETSQEYDNLGFRTNESNESYFGKVEVNPRRLELPSILGELYKHITADSSERATEDTTRPSAHQECYDQTVTVGTSTLDDDISGDVPHDFEISQRIAENERKLSEEQEQLERQIRELENLEIDVDTETDEAEGDVVADSHDDEADAEVAAVQGADDDADKVKDILDSDDTDTESNYDDKFDLEQRYQILLNEIQSNERDETLILLRSYVARYPGRAQQLHAKLSSPSRRRSLQETLKKYQVKQARAQAKREQLKKEKADKIQSLLARVEIVKGAREQLIKEKQDRYEYRMNRAQEQREKYLQRIVERAQDEEKKVKEISFINKIEVQNKRLDMRESDNQAEERLAELELERQKRIEEKLAKEAAVERRRQELEQERQRKLEKMCETRLEREQRIDKMHAEKEQQRQALAAEKARDREERRLALQTQQQQTTEELQRKIEQKQKDSARRHEENIEHIRQRAVELSIPARNTDNDEESGDADNADQEEDNNSSARSFTHNRAYKKKFNRIKQTLREAGEKFCKDLDTMPATLKQESKVPKHLNLIAKGGGTMGLDRCLSHLSLIFQKGNTIDFQCFYTLDGLGILIRHIIRPGITQTDDTISRKTLVSSIQLYRGVCALCPQIGRQAILGSTVTVLFDGVLRFIQIREIKTPSQPVELSTEFMLACTVALTPSIIKKHSYPEILDRLPDLTSYAVMGGLVELLAIRMSRTREPVETKQGEVLALLASIGLLTKIVDICPPDSSECRRLYAIAENTQMFNVVSLLNACVVPMGEKIPPRTVSLAASCFNLLITLAVLDYQNFQKILCNDDVLFKLLDVMTIVVKYGGRTNRVEDQHHECIAMMIDMMACLGFLCAGNKNVQDLLVSEQFSLLLKFLCKLPSNYHAYLYPTLVGVTYQNFNARAVVAREFNLQLLDEYFASEVGQKNYMVNFVTSAFETSKNSKKSKKKNKNVANSNEATTNEANFESNNNNLVDDGTSENPQAKSNKKAKNKKKKNAKKSETETEQPVNSVPTEIEDDPDNVPGCSTQITNKKTDFSKEETDASDSSDHTASTVDHKTKEQQTKKNDAKYNSNNNNNNELPDGGGGNKKRKSKRKNKKIETVD